MPVFSITTSRDVLLAAVQAADDAVERRNTIPVLGNLLLRADAAGRLEVEGTDLDLAITVETIAPAGGLEASGITIPSALLLDILRKLPAKSDVTLAMDGKSAGQATLSSGRSRFSLQTLPAENFPVWTAGQASPARFTIAAGKLAAMLALTAFAISTEETRFYLNGVYMHRHEADGTERLRIVATDGHRLALAEHAGVSDLPDFGGVIVPRKTVGVLQKVLKAAGDETDVEVAVTDSRILFRLPSLSIASKLIDGTYPDYPRVLPTGNANRWRFDSRELSEAAGRVTVISGERGRAVLLDWKESAVALSVVNPDTGDASDEATAVMEAGAPVRIGFNGAYLVAMLERFAGSGTAELGGAGDPALFTPARKEGDEIDARFVLMPMRV